MLTLLDLGEASGTYEWPIADSQGKAGLCILILNLSIIIRVS